MRQLIRRFLQSRGYDIVKTNQYVKEGIPVDMEPEFATLHTRCKAYTMTSVERQYAVFKAVEYIVKNNIKGDLVECGVWRGGNSMMMALALQHFGDTSRRIFLYDTFEGMSDPTEQDRQFDGTDATHEFNASKRDDGGNDWCYADIDDVQQNMRSTNYPFGQISFVKGKVEDTLPNTLPESVAVLRLDTDWYASTYHELVHLYPLLQKNGVLVIDDYGHWQGAREAVDTYLREQNINLLLQRSDYTGRMAIKP